MRVVFDTNVLAAAFVFSAGKAQAAFDLAVGRRFRLLTSVAILSETAQTLRDKFALPDERIVRALRVTSRAAEIVRPSIRLRLVRDDPDNRIIECAVDGKADLIVTGDRGLLDLRSVQGIAIVRLADFLRSFPTSK